MSSHQITQTSDFSCETNTGKAVRPATVGFFTLIGLVRQRRALGRMGEAQLADLGLTRAQADAEAERPFWDVPANWRDNSKSPAFSGNTRTYRA